MVDSNLFTKGVSIYDGMLTIKVTRDRLEVIVVPTPEVSPAQIDMARLHTELRDQGMVFGLLPTLEKKDDGSFAAARGKAAQDGEDAKIVLAAKPVTFHPPEAQLDRERVDFKELHNIVNVREGMVLAEKTPPTPGVAGKDIFGRELAPKPGKDRSLRGGGGVKVTPEGDKLIAGLDGKFVVIDRKPSVVDKHVVMGNVDFAVGNIVFVGKSLVIHGEVMPGFSVKCRGDVEVHNGINNAEVMAGGNLTVHKSVVGEEAVVKVKGDMVADFIESGPLVECGGNLMVNGYILQSHVRVGKEMAVRGEGTIIGGEYVTGGSMYAKELGSDAGVATEVSVGISLNAQGRKDRFDEDIPLWSGRLNDILKAITALEKQKKEEGGLPPEKQEKLKKYSEVLPKLMEKVDNLHETEKQFHEELDKMVDECVYISSKVFPGVTIKIGSGFKAITAVEEGVVAFYDKASRQIHLRKMTDAEHRKIDQ